MASLLPESVKIESSSPATPPPPPPLIIVTLKCSDGKEQKMEGEIAMQSGTIRNMVEEGYTEIPLPNVDSEILKEILFYLMHHYGEKKTDPNEVVMIEFDLKFVNRSIRKLTDLLTAANYLEIPRLINLLSKAIADKINNKSVKAVRKIFNIKSDYTPAEEEEILREYGWAEDGEFDDTVDDDDKLEDGGETEGKISNE